MNERHEPHRRIPRRAGWVNPAHLPKGPNGRALCRRCGVEVPRGCRTFCSDECVHEWKIRTQPAYAREQIEKRDRGVCAQCGLDTRAVGEVLWRVRDRLAQIEGRVRWVPSGDGDGDWISVSRGFIPGLRGTRAAVARAHRTVRTLLSAMWQADHIVPVAEGGGDCGLDNLRTLCSWCHARATRELRLRLNRAARERAAETGVSA